MVDCSKHVMSDHCYWPLVSDLNNVLSHPPIAFRFMADNVLLAMWFDFLKMFQGEIGVVATKVREFNLKIDFTIFFRLFKIGMMHMQNKYFLVPRTPRNKLFR